MAHRSGGRSHSHHSHHSHHRSHHHHGHSYSSSQSAGKVISSKPFLGAQKYMYYNRRGEQRYVYSQGMPVKETTSSLLKSLLVLIPFFVIGFFMTYISLSSMQPAKPLTPVYAPTDVHIEDTIGVIDNMSSLENTLQDFEDLTGISPYILTVYDSEWYPEYDDFWKYALDVYNDKFTDEQHFLVAYSVPDNVTDPDWYDVWFEGIQGDDTDSILTDDKYWDFYNDFERYFSNSSSVGKALNKTFANSLNYIMEGDQSGGVDSWDGLFFSIIWNGFCITFVVLMIRNFVLSRKTYQQVPMDAGMNNGIGQNYNAGMNYSSGTNVNTGINNGINPNNNTGNNYNTSANYETAASNGMSSNYGTNTNNNIGSNNGINTNSGPGTYNNDNTVPWDDDSRYRSEFFYNNTYTNSSNNDGSGYKNK